MVNYRQDTVVILKSLEFFVSNSRSPDDQRVGEGGREGVY